MGHFHYSPQLYINKHSLLQSIQGFDIDFYRSPTEAKVYSMVFSSTRNVVTDCDFEARMTREVKDV